MLKIKNLSVAREGKKILNDLDLEIKAGELHVIMGPNGSGKSTLASVIAGKAGYKVTSGSILFEDKDLLVQKPEERARRGIFMAFQYPAEIAGVNNTYFLKAAVNSIRKERGQPALDAAEFLELIQTKLEHVGLSQEMLERSLNVDFSGGEKKRNEILQLLLLEPRLAILDETDSGLDVDALKLIAKTIETARKKDNAFLVITHNPRLLDYLTPDKVHVMQNGRIVKSGDAKLVKEIADSGFIKSGAKEKENAS